MGGDLSSEGTPLPVESRAIGFYMLAGIHSSPYFWLDVKYAIPGAHVLLAIPMYIQHLQSTLTLYWYLYMYVTYCVN